MGSSLLDQLKKSGLVDDTTAKQAGREKRKQVKQRKGKRPGPTDVNTLRARRARAQKAEQDRALNRQRSQAAERKAIVAQIKQLVDMNRIEDDGGDQVGFNFTDGNTVQRLYVNEQSHGQLVNGRLAIVRLEDKYHLVPTIVAEKIKRRDASCIVVRDVDRKNAGDLDDAYADYPVPDDLMW